MEDIKVFQMDDYEWWAIKGDIEELVDWYRENIDNSYSVEKMIDEAKECDIDTEGMWWATENPADIERLGDYDEIVSYETLNGRKIRKPKFGNLTRMSGSGEIYKFISFRDAIEKSGEYTEPYMIASTEW